ncbi:hypothetical protein Plhal304r1_c001g0002791 [Plasmopara halstedii]
MRTHPSYLPLCQQPHAEYSTAIKFAVIFFLENAVRSVFCFRRLHIHSAIQIYAGKNITCEIQLQNLCEYTYWLLMYAMLEKVLVGLCEAHI